MNVITTPTGDIGGQVLRNLLNRQPAEDLRVVVRDPARLPQSVRSRVDVVAGSHGDPEVVAHAFSGADAVFWLVPPDPMASSLDAAFSGFTQPAAEVFAGGGVQHVVGVSALGRGTAVAGDAGLVTASLAMDDLIAASGVSYRALANPSFMDNTLRQVATIHDEGRYTDTVDPDRKAPAAATRDIAAAAVRLLADRNWTGTGSVAVLGPHDISPSEMTSIMSEVLGKPVRYHRQTLGELAAGLKSRGLSDAFVRGMVDMMNAKDHGLDDGVARTSETSSPTTFAQWCADVLRPAVSGLGAA